MNYMYKVLDQVTNDELINDLKQEMIDKKIKIVDNPELTGFKKSKNGPVKSNGKDTFYYLNNIPLILKNRDECKKPTSISEIRLDLDGKITPENYLEEFPKLKTRYCFTFNTCQAPYTKASMRYQHYYTIMFDNKATCEKYYEWFNKCFKTIQEQEAEDEENKKREEMFKTIYEAQQKLDQENKAKKKKK